MKKGLTLIELIVYTGIVLVLGLFIFTFSGSFYDSIRKSEKLKQFSDNHSLLIKDTYSYFYEGWKFHSKNDNGIIFENSGKSLGFSGYKGYSCLTGGIGITQLFSNIENIDWSNYQKKYEGFKCNEINGWFQYTGFRLNFDLNIEKKNINLKYYFLNND